MSDSKSSSTGLVGILGIVFVVLKLTNLITWSWFWVLAPFWIPLVIRILALVMILLAGGSVKYKGKRI
jgi:hypothetical protein